MKIGKLSIDKRIFRFKVKKNHINCKSHKKAY